MSPCCFPHFLYGPKNHLRQPAVVLHEVPSMGGIWCNGKLILGGRGANSYHSHPHSEARPSAFDVSMALKSGWLDVRYILVSLEESDRPSVRVFKITGDGEVIEDQIEIEN